jgi:acetyl-CoA carboxylase carboxyl transferase subunit beta
MGGSLGTGAGEAVIAAMRAALVREAPFILFAASGGARMQEGILSLMQMPRTTDAVEELREANLPYIVVLTNPTTGGVTASYAMLGDIHIAEPGALIGFAGPRVIEQTIREQLPNGFQRSEYLHDHGMVDMVVHRHELRGTLARLCNLLTHRLASDIEIPVGAGDEMQATLPLDGKAKSGNGVAAEPTEPAEDGEEDEPLTDAPGNGANQSPPQNA